MTAHCKQTHSSNESAARVFDLLCENLAHSDGWHHFHSEHFALDSGQTVYIVFGTNTDDVPAINHPITTYFPFTVKITSTVDEMLGADIYVIVGSNYPANVFDYDEISPSAYTPEMRILLDVTQSLVQFCEVPYSSSGDKQKQQKAE